MISRFIARAFSTFILLSGLAHCQTADQLFGRWKVTEVANAGPVTAMSGADAVRLVGRLLILAPHAVRFANMTCRPTYDVSQETSAEFFADSKVEAKTMNLPDPVTHFEADCTDIFVVAPDKIIFTWEGFFLQAKKLSAKK